MPTLPPRPCTHPSCKAYATKQGRCDEHQVNNWASKTKYRKSSGYEWAARREKALKRDGYLCQQCLEIGRVVIAKEVDHITPVSKGGTDEYSNLVSLCSICHKSKSKAESGIAFSWIRPPSCEVVLVYGPPASGKSTYCKECATGVNDVIIDLDVIIEKLSGKPRIDYVKYDYLRQAIAERNKMLDELSKKHFGTAYVITTTPQVSDRKKRIEKLKPTDVVDLSPSDPYICISRLWSDETRSQQEKVDCEKAIIDWYSKHSV